MENAAITPENYRKYVTETTGERFTATAYNPADWAQLAKDMGAKYTVLTARHHEGFALWPSTHPNAWHAGQAPLQRDFISQYVTAVRTAGLRVGLYYSPLSWRYPGYYDVRGTNCLPNKWGYFTDPTHKENARIMKNEVYQQVKELVTPIRQDRRPVVGRWLARPDGYRRGRRLLLGARQIPRPLQRVAGGLRLQRDRLRHRQAVGADRPGAQAPARHRHPHRRGTGRPGSRGTQSRLLPVHLRPGRLRHARRTVGTGGGPVRLHIQGQHLLHPPAARLQRHLLHHPVHRRRAGHPRLRRGHGCQPAVRRRLGRQGDDHRRQPHPHG